MGMRARLMTCRLRSSRRADFDSRDTMRRSRPATLPRSPASYQPVVPSGTMSPDTSTSTSEAHVDVPLAKLPKTSTRTPLRPENARSVHARILRRGMCGCAACVDVRRSEWACAPGLAERAA
eukprot:351357-Chlamydomonas_euryale.AAC.1